MNNTISVRLSEIQSQLSYNGCKIQLPDGDKTNIYMGIGLWSAKNGLSIGLPVDVMQMLLSTITLRSQILENNVGRSSRIIILIADSMALKEGAKENEVSQIVTIYKKCLKALLDILNLKDNSDIILSSELENDGKYQDTLCELDKNDLLLQHSADKDHYNYIKTQTAISHYMHIHRDVGVKAGWICTDSSKQLNNNPNIPLKSWDELKFDRVYSTCIPNSTLQYLYAKAGMKQKKNGKSVSVSEGCPYTASHGDNRYVIQQMNNLDIKTTCPLQKRVTEQWKNIAPVCAELAELELVSHNILPNDCIIKNNLKTTVYKMLNHWSNILETDNAINHNQTIEITEKGSDS